MDNKLTITAEQFNVLINLPIVKQGYTLYIEDFTEKANEKLLIKSYKRGIKFAGIEFEVDE